MDVCQEYQLKLDAKSQQARTCNTNVGGHQKNSIMSPAVDYSLHSVHTLHTLHSLFSLHWWWECFGWKTSPHSSTTPTWNNGTSIFWSDLIYDIIHWISLSIYMSVHMMSEVVMKRTVNSCCPCKHFALGCCWSSAVLYWPETNTKGAHFLPENHSIDMVVSNDEGAVWSYWQLWLYPQTLDHYFNSNPIPWSCGSYKLFVLRPPGLACRMIHVIYEPTYLKQYIWYICICHMLPFHKFTKALFHFG